MSKRKITRDTPDYLKSARELAKFSPQLKKYARRKTLKPAEKSAIARKERLLKFTEALIPLTPRQAAKLKPHLYQPETTTKSGKIVRHKGFTAIQLRNTDSHAIIRSVSRNMLVTSNGRTWVYWALDDVSPKEIRDAGQEALENPEAYDIEKVMELAERAFETPETKAIALWAEVGRVGETFADFGAFARWVSQSYRNYTQTDRWVRGIAILVGEEGEYIPTDLGGPSTAEKEARRAARRKAQRERQRAIRNRRGL